ncbi:D-lactate dehydrogenase [Mollisia scopiformis]|uniref:D-lactate dehydrogenase n=1 Tax=Mollisia scopiformis TaxID=149040 RepID=A0A194XDY5_MOLSC|nr:D-lactate dehydrogenase [Mollisia scopiformis]KUJ18388.1 D-lactate dehydrogenase [Mollisia scopiformis]
MGSVGSQKLSELEVFLNKHPHITYATPSSPNYASLREIFSLDCKSNPPIIVRPQKAEDVGLLVQYAKSQGIKFAVRTGGHSLFGLSTIDGAMTIDMRDITYVHIEQGKKLAKVGGGTLQGDLATALHKEGLATPTGSVPSVGYVGWAAYGGYGPLSAQFGLGADQIVAAKIVDPSGKIVEADDKLLRGIRGAGGIFGIIVEITVKVYPLNKILAGNLIFASQDISEAFKKFNGGYRELSTQGLPSQLVIQQMVVNSPYGRAFGLAFTWGSDDIDTGRMWLSKIEGLGTVVMNTVAETTIPEMLAATQAVIPLKAYCSSRSLNVRKITEVADAIASCLEKMPSDLAAMFTIHELRGPSAKPTKDSVFGTRDPHFMLEILGGALKEESREASAAWAQSTWETIGKTDRGGQNILPGTYISVEPPGESPGQIPLSKIYGSHESDVVALKREYDSENVFDLAMPRLVDYIRS